MTWNAPLNPATENRDKGHINMAFAKLPPGQRVYAIGDIHGRLDLLRALAGAIDSDDALAPTAQTTVILLGDLIDRGPDSKGVLAFVRAWQKRRTVRVLMGNHEEVFLAAFTNQEALARLLPYGALQTLDSYGITVTDTDPDSLRAIQLHMAACIPAEDRRFMETLPSSLGMGDYLFVHAGIEPDIAIDAQPERSLRWIREPFLSHEEPYERIVVHGHTIRPEIDERGNRIGIDTGAYCYDVLTALVLEGGTRRFLQAQGRGSAVAISERSAAV